MKARDKGMQSATRSSTRKRREMSRSSSDSSEEEPLSGENVSQEGSGSSSESSGWSKEVIEPAIKTMTFRARRGTRMKELMRGKPKNDMFWNRYQGYFGGGLNDPEDEDDQEDYEASSSGRDEFDSDFDLTDSYAGKRGRKKGSKVRRKQRKAASKNNQKILRGKKKESSEEQSSEKRQSHQQQKVEQVSTSECAFKLEGSAADNRKRKMDISSEREGPPSSFPEPDKETPFDALSKIAIPGSSHQLQAHDSLCQGAIK